MNVIRRRGWEMPEHLATPEHVFLNRRDFLGAAARRRRAARRGIAARASGHPLFVWRSPKT